MVKAQHAVHYLGRDVPSLKQKYNALHRLQIPTGNPNMPDKVQQVKRIKHTIGLKADLGDREEEFDLEEGYSSQQQGPPLQQSSQEQQEQEVPGSGTTAGSLKASGRRTSPCLTGTHLEPQLKQKDDKDDEGEGEGDDEEEEEGPIPEGINTTVSTTLTIPGLKRSYNRSQVQ